MAYKWTLQVSAVAILLCFLLYKAFARVNKRRLPIPPGPKGVPLLGNITDLPPAGVPEHEHWLGLKERYGPIISITVMGTTLVIIHDKGMAMELMEKRGSKHSGRVQSKFAMDMLGYSNLAIGQQYDRSFRQYRKYMNQHIGTKSLIMGYDQSQEAAVTHLLWKLKRDAGANLLQHVKTEAGEVIMNIIYGYNVEPHGSDKLLDLVDSTMEEFSLATVPGAWLVDLIPALAYLPSWLPGAGFKRTAKLWRQHLLETSRLPYEFARERQSRPDAVSFVNKAIRQAKVEDSRDELTGHEEYVIKNTALSLFTGGADTTVGTIHGFFLAMSMYPEVQRLAQAEIDSVVGPNRTPTIADRDRLPYLNAVTMEAQRWHPLAPMGFPHVADEEDTVGGYSIPKGALLLPSIYWFSRDPAVYHDFEAFKPERYAKPYSEPPPTDFTFGFGRRVCPGRVLADSSLYLTFAKVLATLNIEKALDGDKRPIEPVHKFLPGIISHLGPFQVRITPRSNKHAQMIDELLNEHPFEEGDMGKLNF